ncbi:MAG: class I SAM-dependent methyltransferase [Magnetococcales bacterium]|nr:class I SAM-dependent methyltransferase [Magnetococcales bacterium]
MPTDTNENIDGAPETDTPYEYTGCPICGSSKRREGYRFEPPFTAAWCMECGTLYLHPRLKEQAMAERYAQLAYFDGANYQDYRKQERSLSRTFQSFLKRLERRGCLGGRLLELGSGLGWFLRASEGYFDERIGMDLSTEAASEASAYADSVLVGGIEQAPDGPFDLIAAIQVLEHVYDPDPFLSGIAQRLAPDGFAAIVVPDRGSWMRPLLGTRWPSFKIPEHLLYLNETDLRTLFERNGFTNVQRIAYPHAFPLDILAGFAGLSLPEALQTVPIWIPGTSLAMIAQRA